MQHSRGVRATARLSF